MYFSSSVDAVAATPSMRCRTRVHAFRESSFATESFHTGRDLFRSVQAEYEAENVPWAPIDFPDAAAALKLIEGSMGVVDVLDEECARPGAISASRCVETPSRHRRDSCSSDEVVGGFFFEFEAIRTEPRCSAQVARK